MHSKIICCKLYISESQNAAVVDAISSIGQKDPEVVLLSKFEDEYYNRVRYTLVSYITSESSTGEAVFSPIRKVLLAMIEAAFSAINLKVHSGTHPRIGVVDDMSFHPLSPAATMEDAAQLAKLVASDIGNGLQGSVLRQDLLSLTNEMIHYINILILFPPYSVCSSGVPLRGSTPNQQERQCSPA